LAQVSVVVILISPVQEISLSHQQIFFNKQTHQMTNSLLDRGDR
jgi:hypothetical protein